MFITKSSYMINTVEQDQVHLVFITTVNTVQSYKCAVFTLYVKTVEHQVQCDLGLCLSHTAINLILFYSVNHIR